MKRELKRTFLWLQSEALFLSLALATGPSAALAADGAHDVLKTADAVVYELSENACLVDATGQCTFAMGTAVARGGTSPLQGIAKLGTALCPSSVLHVLKSLGLANPKTDGCTVIATVTATASFVNGKGPLSDGFFWTVIQLDNPVDSPELPVMSGTITGDIDFTPAFNGIPLGYVSGTLQVTSSPFDSSLVTGVPVRFSAVFRGPFGLSATGHHVKPRVRTRSTSSTTAGSRRYGRTSEPRVGRRSALK